MKKWVTRLFSCLLITVLIAAGISFPARAEQEDKEEIQIIQGFEEIEDSCITLSEKCSLTDLHKKMPGSIGVYLEGKSGLSEIPVTWEADQDYENTDKNSYVFWAKWDENLYQVDKSYSGTFDAGTEYRGIPYGQLVDAGKYVPDSASMVLFVPACRVAVSQGDCSKTEAAEYSVGGTK